MITFCHAAKGGSGTTFVACTMAIHTAGPTLLVDFDDDVPSALGSAEPDRPGVSDWLASRAPNSHLDDLLVELAPETWLLATRGPRDDARCERDRPIDELDAAEERWDELFDWLADWCDNTGGSVVVDAGTRIVPRSFVEQCPQRWLVTRSCYLGLRRAARRGLRPTGVVLIEEVGRALGRRDVEASIGAPVVATIAWDARVATALDCGLLLARPLPRRTRHQLTRTAA